jgi:hypothetical protein
MTVAFFPSEDRRLSGVSSEGRPPRPRTPQVAGTAVAGTGSMDFGGIASPKFIKGPWKKNLTERPSTADKAKEVGPEAIPSAAVLRKALPSGSLIIDFTIGKDFKFTLNEINKALKRNFGGLVTVRSAIDPNIKGVSRCFLHAGRGVMIWDRPTMMMHRDDPFESFDSARDFVQETISTRIPVLLRAASLCRQ